MSAHTPGPWIWAKSHRGLYGAGPDNAVLDYAHYEGMWLASPNEVANACLIAAAPELLEAAKYALSRDADSYLFTKLGIDVEQALVAAIAKAEGRA